MKVFPILFSTAMIQPILEGQKKMTRRIVKRLPNNASDDLVQIMVSGHHGEYGHINCPYGKVGDVLWVRETWKSILFNDDSENPYMIFQYKDGMTMQVNVAVGSKLFAQNKWKPSIHLIKSGSRIWLRVKSVTVERLLSISKVDAIAEGIENKDGEWVNYLPKILNHLTGFKDPVQSFASLWAKIHSRSSWNSNPWVWVIKFEVMSTTGRDALPKAIIMQLEGKGGSNEN